MQTFMLKLDRTLRRHRLLVLGVWVAAFVAAIPFAAKQSDNLTGGGFGVPGSQSKAVEDRAPAGLPRLGARVARRGAPPREGRDGGRHEGRARAARRRDARGPAHRARRAGRARAPRRASARAGRSSSRWRPRSATATPPTSPTTCATPRTSGSRSERVTTHLVGQGALWSALQETAKHDVEVAERQGFPIVALILLAVFGSFAAAVLPLALGAGAVIITGALIYFLSLATEMSVFVTNMASMIGIGVAVDYSLFVLARYREEVRAGRAPDEARGVALATSGLAVIFSGLTVIASLAGLFLINTTALRSMAIGAILVVVGGDARRGDAAARPHLAARQAGLGARRLRRQPPQPAARARQPPARRDVLGPLDRARS